jgi:hypothetical protein
MTVGELRKALEGVPDDMTVLAYDEGYLKDETYAEVCRCAPLPGETVLCVIDEHSRHPEGTVGQACFLVY